MAHRAWREARERALAAVRAGDGLVVVLGPSGTGKSLLLRELARALGRDGHDVLLRPRGDVPVEADARAAGDAPGGTAGALGPRVVLIDEAHRLDGAALDRLGRLGARHVLLAGVPGSGEGFDLLPARATVVRLAPLPPGEVGAFTAALLARAGRGAPPPSERAVRRLAECSGGVPRTLDVLVGASALLAAAEGAACLDVSHVDRVAATRGGAAVPAASAPGDGDARGHDGADARASTPAVEPPPGRGRAARRRVAPGVPLGAVLGAGLCAVGGVAGYYGWQSLRADPDARRGQPVSARADAAPPGPPPAATPDVAVTPRGPGPGRADTALIAPGPAAVAASRTPTAPEAIAPGPASGAPEAGAPAAPGPAIRAVPEPAAPAAVGPAVPLAPEPVAPAASERAASFAPERRERASAPPESGRPPARPVLAALAPVQTPAARALPVGAPVQVVIYHPRDDARAAARAVGLARVLREAGMVVGEPVAAQRGGKPGVRYFFAEDRDAAIAILERSGLAAADVQVGDARPGILPRPGAIEITLPPG